MASYEIRISGFKDTLQIENGVMLKAKWEQFKQKRIKDELIEVKGWSGMLSDIKSFRLAQSSNAENQDQEKAENKYRKDLHAFRSLPPEQKAKRMGFFRLMYFGFTGRKSENMKTTSGKTLEELAEAIQKKFFEENPKRMFCDPQAYKPLIKSNECERGVMSIIENQIRQDKFSERYL